MILQLAEASDADLVDLYHKHRNKQAFGELYQRYLDAVYGFVYSRVGNQPSAEEITSDTFLTLLDVIDKYQPTAAKFKTFVIGIALNKIRQHWHKLSKQKQVQFDEDWLMVEPEPEEDNVEEIKKHTVLLKQMKQVLIKLPADYRSVLEWRFMKGCSIKETAEKLGITEENVKVRQNRAIKKAQQLAEEVLHAS